MDQRVVEEARDSLEWAKLLKREWEARARSPFRDFFVASHQGWDDRKVRERRAAADAEMALTGLHTERLARMEVLEVGCGVGRLAGVIAPRVKGYTGFDIAPAMVEEARRKNEGLENVRFFVSGGLDLPMEAKDREYDLAFALAVFIHCPRDVIGELIRNVYTSLAPGGEFRFQVSADPSDPTGIRSAEDARAIHERIAETETALPAGAEAFLSEHYIGARFRFEEMGPFLREAGVGGGAARIERYDLGSIYVILGKP